jgi:Rad3-related DNA helicase
VGGQHHAPAALHPGETQYPLYRRLGGPQGRTGRVQKISPPPGFDPRTVQPVAIPTAIPAPYVIDTFSKFAWSLPVKKDGVTVSKAFRKIIKRAESQKHKSPDLFRTDKGLEFKNKHFKNLLNSFNIKMYHTQNEEKSAIIEKFNRTLNNKMRIQFEVRNNK